MRKMKKMKESYKTENERNSIFESEKQRNGNQRYEKRDKRIGIVSFSKFDSIDCIT